MLDKINELFQFQQTALHLCAKRQENLAANIANADTPGYQARDINFASQLTKIMNQVRNNNSFNLSLKITSNQHIPIHNFKLSDLDLLYRVPDQPALDGNTVDIDRERTNFADNSLKYQTSLAILGSQIKGMMSVLQSGPS